MMKKQVDYFRHFSLVPKIVKNKKEDISPLFLYDKIFLSYERSDFIVFLPTIPSSFNPFSDWKAKTNATVLGP